MSGTESQQRDVDDGAWYLRIGRDELVIRQRYDTLSIANDVLIGVWFLVGSILFFSESTSYVGTWLFVIGSVEMLVRPVIRLARRVHLQRLRPDAPVHAVGSQDY